MSAVETYRMNEGLLLYNAYNNAWDTFQLICLSLCTMVPGVQTGVPLTHAVH